MSKAIILKYWLLDELQRACEDTPHLRLGQLLVNVVHSSEPCPEVFYITDEELLKKLQVFRQNLTIDYQGFSKRNRPKEGGKK